MSKKSKPASPPAPKPRRGRGVPLPPDPDDRAGAPLTALEQAFQEKLKACTPLERGLVRNILAGQSKSAAAANAGYKGQNTDVLAAQALRRARVREALEAGWDAAGWGAREIIAMVEELAGFDRAMISSPHYEVVADHVERPAAEVVQELITRERVAQAFLETMRADDQTDESALKLVQRRLNALLMRRLELEEQLALDPEATTFETVQRRHRVDVVDFEKAHRLGMTRFITGVKRTKYGYDVETVDREANLVLAAKIRGLLRERLSLENPDGSALDSAELPVDTAEAVSLYKTMVESTRGIA